MPAYGEPDDSRASQPWCSESLCNPILQRHVEIPLQGLEGRTFTEYLDLCFRRMY